METTERIVEAYVRYVKHWATIPNIRCPGQNEIDLLAIDPVTLDRYHIEVSISIAQGFSRLTGRPFDPEMLRDRVQQPSQRRTVGFFRERKFNAPTVIGRLREFGFEEGGYSKVIVTWGWDDQAAVEAKSAGIGLWDFRNIVREIADTIRGSSQYFADDTLRTLNLFIHADDEAARRSRRKPLRPGSPPEAAASVPASGGYWVYENRPNNCATVHEGACAFCNDGRGLTQAGSTDNGRWLGPFDAAPAAWVRARETGRRDIRRCGICQPVIPE